MWAVKTPKGKLITSSAKEDKTEALEDYVEYLIKLGFLKMNLVPYGLDYYEKMWAVLKTHGYQIVRCFVEMKEFGAFKIPELIELPHQAYLEYEETRSDS